MNPILAGVTLAVIAGSIIAVSVRDARGAILALALVLVLSPLVADPLAAPSGLAARMVGGVLAAYLLWMVVRGRPGGMPAAETGGSRIGWPAELLLAASAAVVGFAAHGLGAPAAGPAIASAGEFAVAALTIAPVLTSRDLLRMGIGLLLLLDAGLLVRAALGGTPGPFEELLSAALTVATGGALAAAAVAARGDGIEGFALALDPRPRVRREPDAHLIQRR